MIPRPTRLSDKAFVDNLRIVVDATLHQLEANPETLALVRQGSLGIIIHDAGEELVQRGPVGGVGVMDRLMDEIADAVSLRT